MINIVLGAIAILLGLWLMFAQWWATIDLLRTVIPVFITAYGVIALMAGLKKFVRKTSGEDN
ncbi:hypothetical protein ACFL1X_02325 [Candidatus Hydrogenedentota bacterium]